MHNRKPEIGGPFRIVIANNYPPLSGDVEQLVSEIRARYSKMDFWEWIIIHRKETVDAAMNCLSAIQDHAKDNEVVIVQGDDDLFMPWSIADRVETIEDVAADVLLTKSKYSLWYLDESGRVYFGDTISAYNGQAKGIRLDWSEINDWIAIFLGNNCYRYTEKFQNALDLIFKWFEEQHWLDFNTSSHMWPMYLPYAVKLFEGKVIGLDQFCVIRGNLLAERVNDPFEISFNTGLLSLCALGVLQNKDLGGIRELEDTRRSLGEYIYEWVVPMFLDRRVSKKVRSETFRHIPLPLKYATFSSILRGMKKVVKNYLRIQLLLTRLRARNSQQTVNDLINDMLNLTHERLE